MASHRRVASLAAALVALAPAVGCDGGAGEPGPGGPSGPGPPSAGEPRSYLMGWAPSAPRPEEDLFLAVMDSMAAVSEVAIVQQAVPWARLLAGEPVEALVGERVALADHLRSLGMEVVYVVDPLDNLDRRREDPALVSRGGSLTDPRYRATFDAWVLRIAEEVEPWWMGLVAEVNTLAAWGDPALYAAVRGMVNDLAPRVRERSPGTRVFVSFQVDVANGTIGRPVIDHFALVDDFDVDGLGLSSYPVIAFDAPADIPDDYLSVFDDATDLPLLVVEGGWSSEDVPWSSGTPEGQVEWMDRWEDLLDGIGAVVWLGLTPTDLEVEAFGLPPDRALGISNFAHMGIWDTDLQRKPAFAEWARIFARPPAGR